LIHTAHANAEAVAVSPDGHWVATGAASGYGVRVWDARTGKQVSELLSGAWSSHPYFSPDGRWLLITTATDIRVWEPGTWREVRKLAHEQVTGSACNLAFSPDGKVLAVAVSLTTIRLFDTDTWRPLARLQGPNTDRIHGLRFTRDGAQVLVYSQEGTDAQELTVNKPPTLIRAWDLRRIRERLAEATLDWDLLAYPPARDSSSPPLRVMVVEDEAEVRRFEGYVSWVDAVAGLSALSSNFDKTLRLWDEQSDKVLRRFSGRAAGVLNIAFSADGRRALSIHDDRTLRLWDVQSGEQLHCFTVPGKSSFPYWPVALSPDGRNAVSSDGDATVLLWDLSAGKEPRRLQGHEHAIIHVSFSPDNRYALSGDSAYETLRLWEVASGREVRRFVGGGGGVQSAAFSPNGRRIVSGGSGMLRLWDTDSGKELHCFNEGRLNDLGAVAFSPDGQRVLAGSRNGAIGLWDLNRKQFLQKFTGHNGQVRRVAFSPDGRLALSAGQDNTLRLWKLPPDTNAAPPEKKTDAK
jgi:WD40 repeat protein